MNTEIQRLKRRKDTLGLEKKNPCEMHTVMRVNNCSFEEH